MSGLAGSSVAVGAAIALAAWQTPARDATSRPTSRGTGVIAGIVGTTGSDRRPLRRATVALNGGHVTNLLAITDDSGRFAFRGLPSGRYTLRAEREGYVTSWYGATRPAGAGVAVPLDDGEQITDLFLPLLRGSVIDGTISTESGEPASAARVIVLGFANSPATGERILIPVAGLGTSTDDRGGYRIYGLTPGEYLVAAISSAPGRDASPTTEAQYQRALQAVRGTAGTGTAVVPPTQTMGSVPIFYPGTTQAAQAQRITLSPAEERDGVDFSIRPVSTGRIEGRVLVDGEPLAGATITVADSQQIPGFSGESARRAVSDRDGHFTVAGLGPGRYGVVAQSHAGRTSASPSRSLWALDEVTTDGRDISISMTLRAGVTVSGVLMYETAGVLPPPDPSRARITLQPVRTDTVATLNLGLGRADGTGAFIFEGVMPGRYRVVVDTFGPRAPDPGWFVSSVTAHGQALGDEPLDVGTMDVPSVEVRLTDRPTELTGVMLDAAGRPTPEYFLIVFPRDERLRVPASPRIKQARPGADGKFLFRGLPQGDYLLAAVTDVRPGEWYDRAFLEAIAQSNVAITLAPGERKIQDIRVK